MVSCQSPKRSSRPARLQTRLDRGMALEGKKFVITGGAGFIGTTLARRLVDANEIIAFDHLHRDALARHRSPTTRLHARPGRRARRRRRCAARERRDAHCPLRRDRRRRHRARQPGAHDARQHDRHATTCSRPRSRRRHAERFVEFSTSEIFGTHAFRFGEDDATVVGYVGEARWTYAVSKLAGEHLALAFHHEFALPTVVRAAVQRLRAGPDRRGRDPRVHRGGARRAAI